jgi:acyl carrier protein
LKPANAEEENGIIKEAVKRFILSSIDITNLDDDDNLFDSGIVNSLFAIQLMTFIEKTFAIEVAMDDLDIENFKSLNAAAAFVVRKRHSALAKEKRRVCSTY